MGGEAEAILAGVKTAKAIGEFRGIHGQDAIHEIDRVAAPDRFFVERRTGSDIVGDIGDVHPEFVAVCRFAHVDGIIQIAGIQTVNRDRMVISQIPASAF